MKMINYLLFGFLLLGTNCSKEEPNRESIIKDKLIGKWTEISPCDLCRTYTFALNDTIYQENEFGKAIYRLSYQIVNNDSIQVTRLWDIEQSKKITKHSIMFLSSDTIIIEQFNPVDFGIIGFEDVKMTKN